MPDDLRYVPNVINGFGQRRAISCISRLSKLSQVCQRMTYRVALQAEGGPLADFGECPLLRDEAPFPPGIGPSLGPQHSLFHNFFWSAAWDHQPIWRAIVTCHFCAISRYQNIEVHLFLDYPVSYGIPSLLVWKIVRGHHHVPACDALRSKLARRSWPPQSH
jgi:hypothetical protein